MSTRRSWGRKTVLAGLAAIAFGGVGLVVWLLGRDDGKQAASTDFAKGSSAPRPRARPRPLGRGARELQAALNRDLRPVGGGSAAYVYDLTADQQVFALRARDGRPPASVEKLYTSVALLRSMGAQARLHTTVMSRGSLGGGGVWRGNLYLRGGGDPTFGALAFNHRWLGTDGATVSELVRQLSTRGIKRVSGSVVGDGTLFDGSRGGPSTRFAPNIIDLGGQLDGLTFNHGAAPRMLPEAFAAQQLALALHAARVPTGPGGATAKAPSGARKLASVSSPPMSTLLRLMNVPSDDFFAEMLTKQLGARFEGGGSTSRGTRVISRHIGAFGIHPKVVDGSGLSRDNSSSPRDVVKVLRGVWRTPTGDVLSASLPSVGVNGTVRRIAAATPARGQCVAKTGTLAGVTNLAGYCHSAGRQLLAFAVFLDGPTNERGIQLLSQVVTDMVRINVARR